MARSNSSWERIAIFIVCCVLVVVILAMAVVVKEPTSFAIVVFRVVLALAAAGVVAFIPGGKLDLSLGSVVKAGGGVAFGVLVYLFNPPSLVRKDDGAYEDAMRQAEAGYAAWNFAASAHYFEQARKLRPDDPLPYHGLGKVAYARGNYADALNWFQLAAKHYPDVDGPTEYAIEMAQEAIGLLEDARKTIKFVQDRLPTDSSLYLSAKYDEGLLALLLWEKDKAPSADPLFDEAVQTFRAYLEKPGNIPQWAHYHLACLKATRSEDGSLPEPNREKLRAEAQEMLRESVKELAKYKGANAGKQWEMMRTLLTAHEGYSRKSGEPVACAPLVRVWNRSNGGVESLIGNR